MGEKEKVRAGRNRTIVLTEEDKKKLDPRLVKGIGSPIKSGNDINSKQGNEINSKLGNGINSRSGNDANSFSYLDKTINSDLLQALPLLPDAFADLIIIDPPYNLTKNFGGKVFNERKDSAYEEYLESWFPQVCRKLKANGSLYM